MHISDVFDNDFKKMKTAVYLLNLFHTGWHWRGSAVAAVPVSEAASRRSVCAPASAAARVPLQRKAGTKQSCKSVDDIAG